MFTQITALLLKEALLNVGGASAMPLPKPAVAAPAAPKPSLSAKPTKPLGGSPVSTMPGPTGGMPMQIAPPPTPQ